MRDAPTSATTSVATTNGTYRCPRIMPAVRRASIPHTARLSVAWPEGKAYPENVYPRSKRAGGRARPPARFDLGYTFSGYAFPSGHATESLAVWGMLALLTAGMMRGHRYVPFVVATLVVALVGASRIYLGAHWLSDVLGGFALGGLWLALLVAVMLSRAKPRGGDVRIAEVVDEAA